MSLTSRRDFVQQLGLSSAALPFVLSLPSLSRAAADKSPRKQRLIVMFSPNGTIMKNFWPKETGEKFKLKPIMQPLAKYQDRMLMLRGVSDLVRGDGDSHMRGMSCLLTGIELFPGNIQGGSHTPAGWAKGLSIDQELKNFFQSREQSRTRFGSLEFGVAVPDRANPWTRMVYAGANKPIAPIDDPYQMFAKLYGKVQDRESLKSILDDVREDLRKVRDVVSKEDRHLLAEHEAFVRQMEKEFRADAQQKLAVDAPVQKPGVKTDHADMPKTSKMQIDMIVNSMANDMTRVATLQYTRSVGGARMKWLGFDEGHHSLSHKPDSDKTSQEKLTKINTWYCQQLAYLVERLDKTPEPGGDGSLLDNTMIVWTNELGKGNSHTLENIPFVLVGGGMDFRMGRSLKYKRAAHNRLWMSIAHAVGHPIKAFGNPNFCGAGPLDDLT